MRLGVNIDHVATLRQARQDIYPNLMAAAEAAMQGGADSITMHLREDRRHIIDQDIYDIAKTDYLLNMEMALNPDIIAVAKEVKPYAICVVPEKRAELTTEGGLNLLPISEQVAKLVKDLPQTHVVPFLDPDLKMIKLAAEIGCYGVELHTGCYGNAERVGDQELEDSEFQKLKEAANYCVELGLKAHAGHGLTYDNVGRILKITEISELNIGHNIVARAVFVGLQQAVADMKSLIDIV